MDATGSMTGPALLRGGVLATAGTYYLLCDHVDAEDDEVIVASGRRDRDRIELRELTDLEEIVALIPLLGAWSGVAEAAAMTADGLVLLLTPGAATPDPVPGAGFERPEALGLGRMTALAQVGDHLFALGYGGQAYRRTPASGWQNLNIPPEVIDAGYDPCLYAVAGGLPNGALSFGGLDIGQVDTTPEMDAANDADDGDLLADLLLAEDRPNRGALRIYDGRWRRTELDTPSAIIEILPAPGGSWYVVGAAVIWLTRDFLAFEEVAALPARTAFQDVKAQGEKVLLLVGNELDVLDSGGMVSFDPPLPPIDGPYLGIAPAGRLVAAIFKEGVMLSDGGAWERLYPVFG